MTTLDQLKKEKQEEVKKYFVAIEPHDSALESFLLTAIQEAYIKGLEDFYQEIDKEFESYEIDVAMGKILHKLKE